MRMYVLLTKYIMKSFKSKQIPTLIIYIYLTLLSTFFLLFFLLSSCFTSICKPLGYDRPLPSTFIDR